MKQLSRTTFLLLSISLMTIAYFLCNEIVYANICGSYNRHLETRHERLQAVAGSTIYEFADIVYAEHKVYETTGMCFEEYLYNVRKSNNGLQNGSRCLQVGDVVEIPYWVKAPKD